MSLPTALLGHWAEVWTLCEALWGRLGPAEQEPGAADQAEAEAEASGGYQQQLERRRTFSAWLSSGATSRVEEEVALAGKGRHTDAIFSYLTGNRISEACRLAQKEGEEGEGLKEEEFLLFLLSINNMVYRYTHNDETMQKSLELVRLKS